MSYNIMIQPKDKKTSILRIPNTKPSSKIEEVCKYKVRIKETGEKIEVTKSLMSQHNSLSKFKENFNNSSLELTYEAHKTELKDDNFFFVSLSENKIIKIDNLYDFKVKRETVNLNPKKSVLPQTGMRKELQEIEDQPFLDLTVNYNQEENELAGPIVFKSNKENCSYDINGKPKKKLQEEFNYNFLISLIKKQKVFNYSNIMEFFAKANGKKISVILKQFCFVKFGRYFLKANYWPVKYRSIFESLIKFLDENKEIDLCKVKFFKSVNKHDNYVVNYVFNNVFKLVYTSDNQLVNKMYLNFHDEIVTISKTLCGSLDNQMPLYILKGYNEEITTNKEIQSESKDIETLIHEYLREPKTINEIINEFSYKFTAINVDLDFIKNFSNIMELSNKKYISSLGRSKIQIIIIELFVDLPVIKKKDVLCQIKKNDTSSVDDKVMLADMKEILQVIAEPKGQSWYIKL